MITFLFYFFGVMFVAMFIVYKEKKYEWAELWLLEKGRMYVICESDITDLIHDWRKAMEE